MILLEKAWAKLHGGYCKIRSGHMATALAALTNKPSIVIDHDLVKDLNKEVWDKLRYANHLYAKVCASSSAADNFTETVSKGIVTSHGYAVIGVHEIVQHGETIRLLKLRNPWGSSEWDGDWSDKSHKWTPDLRQQLGHKDAEDGIFFIALTDYI